MGSTTDTRGAPHWKVALVLGVAGGVASLLLVPYVRAVAPPPAHPTGLPFPVMLGTAWLESTVVLTLLAWAGLRLGASIGLDAPLLRARLSGRAPAVRGHWLVAVAAGVVASAVVVLLEVLVFRHAMAEALARTGATPHAARWKGALACFYGGIAEEVQLRLFFMTLVAWGLARSTRGQARWIYVAANVVAALAFGAGHLPLAAKVFGLTAVVVVRTILLNAVAGVAFGELYTRWGLEHAMVAHFCADVVLHVVIGG